MQAHILREKFLNFFKSKKHKIVEPDSLVPKDDPTVLFTPAGMNQFKKEFLGFNSGFTRAATCQRCLRTGDLDKVGVTSGHHTFFEMLGNFSFGDYFKKEAIFWAWEFFIEELKINKERLWVSVYEDDDEAYKIWSDFVKISKEKIIKLGDKENFWPSEAKEKGPNGPCGPCSEIFFDQGSDIGCKRPDCNPSCNCGRFVEVWNLVFTQYNRREGGILEPLPKKNIDTGMGLERLAAVMQGVPNNFETDLFKPLVKEIVAGCRPQVVSEKELIHSLRSVSILSLEHTGLIYAVADHIRAIAFAIYDGVLPSNEARGYVIRKLIRKSTLYLRTMGFSHPFLYKLVPVLAQGMEQYYAHLQERKENIAEIILAEEKNFISTLNSSERLFREKFEQFKHKPDPESAGKIAFQLYDTYGIPMELTQEWLNRHAINVSQEAFNKELLEQRERSKLLSSMKGEVFGAKDLDYGVKETKFLGYKDYAVKAKIVAIIKDNAKIKKINKGDKASLILDKTVFYPESGGQVGDTGEIIKGKNLFEVSDTKKAGKVILHIGVVKSGSFKKSDLISAEVNIERRLSIARNHTATHLLQAALKKVLGEHVQQQGSLVAEDRLRFDFTHFKALDKRELGRVEEIVNSHIINNHALKIKTMDLKEAKKCGALAFFAEKYEGRVRVVAVEDFSRELCAGTHLENTGQIGLFKIIQEGSVASGIRRIEATTGTHAYKLIIREEVVISDISSILKVPQEKITPELQKKLSQIKELEKEKEGHKSDILKTAIENDISKKEDIKGTSFIVHIDQDVNSVRKAVDLIKEKVGQNAVIVSTTGSNFATQVFFAIGVTADLSDKKLDASELVKDKELASEIGGSGGGRKDFAQIGGNKPGNYTRAIERLKQIILGKLS
jgi:alanyl-tRNA synthetase